MKPRASWVVAIILTLSQAAALAQPSGEADEPQDEIEYKPTRLPLSAKAARTWIALQETRVKPLPDGTPFGEVLKSLAKAARGPDGSGPGLSFYVNPVSLNEVEMTLESPLPSPEAPNGDLTIQEYLKATIPSPLKHHVHDGVVIIKFPCDDCPGHLAVGAAEAWTWLLLQEEVSLDFSKGT